MSVRQFIPGSWFHDVTNPANAFPSGARTLTTALVIRLLLLPSTAHPASPITALAFCPDNSALLSNGPRTIEIRSPTNAAVLRRVDCPLPKIHCLQFDIAGRRLAVAGGTPGEGGETLVFSWPEATLTFRRHHPNDVVTSLAFSPDGTRLAVAGGNQVATVWNLNESSDPPPLGKATEPPPLFHLQGHAGAIHALAWDASNACIATASSDRSLKVWSPGNGHLIRTFTHHTEPPLAIAFRPSTASTDPNSQPILASAGEDQTVRIWQPTLGRMVRIVRHHHGPILALAWTPDGSSLISAGSEGILRRIDASSDAILAEWRGHDDWIHAIAVSPDGLRLASGDAAGTVRLWSLQLNSPELLSTRTRNP